MFGILGGLGSIFSFLSGIAPAVSSYFTAKTDSQTTEYVSLSETERAEYVAATQAITAANSAKVANNTSKVAQFLMLVFGGSTALHWSWTMFTATFPQLGLHTDTLGGAYASSEVTIALSFFVVAPTMAAVTRIRG